MGGRRSTYLVEMVLMEPVVTIRREMSPWYRVQAILVDYRSLFGSKGEARIRAQGDFF